MKTHFIGRFVFPIGKRIAFFIFLFLMVGTPGTGAEPMELEIPQPMKIKGNPIISVREFRQYIYNHLLSLPLDRLNVLRSKAVKNKKALLKVKTPDGMFQVYDPRQEFFKDGKFSPKRNNKQIESGDIGCNGTRLVGVYDNLARGYSFCLKQWPELPGFDLAFEEFMRILFREDYRKVGIGKDDYTTHC